MSPKGGKKKERTDEQKRTGMQHERITVYCPYVATLRGSLYYTQCHRLQCTSSHRCTISARYKPTVERTARHETKMNEYRGFQISVLSDTVGLFAYLKTEQRNRSQKITDSKILFDLYIVQSNFYLFCL